MRHFHILVLLVFSYLLFGIIRSEYGLFNGDEGWYLLSVENVLQGKKLYADFLYTQTPFLPYFYAAIMSVTGISLAAGRWISFLLGLGSVLMTMVVCHRRAGIHGAVIAGLLLCFNLDFIFHVAMLATPSLTVFLVAGSIYLLASPGTSSWRSATGLLLMALAVLTRLSMLPAFLVFVVYLAVVFRKRPVLAAGVFILHAVLIGGAIWYFYSDGNLLFGVKTFHHEYYRDASWSISRCWRFIRGTVENQLPLLVCIAWSLEICVAGRPKSKKTHSSFKNGDGFLWVLALSYLGTSLVHITRPIAYPSYQTSNILFAVVFCAIVMGRYMSELPRGSLGYAVLVPLVVLAMPTQEYRIVGNGKGSLRRVTEVAAAIRQYSKGEGPLLTMAPELAVESGLALLPGYEMGRFSYFADMPDERAEKLHIVNFRRLQHDLKSKAARIVCLTDYDLSVLGRGRRDALDQAIKLNYKRVTVIQGYGRMKRPLLVFVAK